MSKQVKKQKEVFFFEYTDLFGGECNYCWLHRYRVKASTFRGAVNVLSREIGLSFRFDGWKYVSRSGCTAFYELDNAWDLTPDEVEAYKPVNF